MESGQDANLAEVEDIYSGYAVAVQRTTSIVKTREIISEVIRWRFGGQK